MTLAERRQSLRADIARTRARFVRQSYALRADVRELVLTGRSAVRLVRTLFALVRALRRKT